MGGVWGGRWSPAEVHQVDEGGEVLHLVGHQVGGGVRGLQHHGAPVVLALRDGEERNIGTLVRRETLVSCPLVWSNVGA